jgi:hypothetical protein
MSDSNLSLKLSQGEVHDFSGEVQKFSGEVKTISGGVRTLPLKSGHILTKIKLTSGVRPSEITK